MFHCSALTELSRGSIIKSKYSQICKEATRRRWTYDSFPAKIIQTRPFSAYHGLKPFTLSHFFDHRLRNESDCCLKYVFYTNRSLYSSSSLVNEDIQDDGDEELITGTQIQNWMKMFNALKEYKSEHGDMMVPTVYPPNFQLANFVQRMRNLYSSYENGPPPKGLIKARFELLEKEGFVWDVHQLNWDAMYDKLKEYVEEHGDSCVPSRYEHDPQLGQWVLTQRNTYKTERHKSDPTFAERVERLEKLNFVWYQQEAIWMERFDELKKYKAETGDW
jgi:hypothetical protein